MSGLLFEEETFQIRGACFDVYNEMGCGFLESVYQECLEIAFRQRSIPFVAQSLLKLRFMGQELKQVYKPDFVCYGKIIVEIKAVSAIVPEHQAQVMHYLKATGFDLGLLVNFGAYPSLGIQRFANTQGNRLKGDEDVNR